MNRRDFFKKVGAGVAIIAGAPLVKIPAVETPKIPRVFVGGNQCGKTNLLFGEIFKKHYGEQSMLREFYEMRASYPFPYPAQE
jgi:hypothetical protein